MKTKILVFSILYSSLLTSFASNGPFGLSNKEKNSELIAENKNSIGLTKNVQSEKNEKKIVWPSEQPRNFPIEIQSKQAECRANFDKNTAESSINDCLRWSVIGKGKALFGVTWLKAGDAFPWRENVKVALICSQKVVLDNGETIGINETLPINPPKLRRKFSKECL